MDDKQCHVPMISNTVILHGTRKIYLGRLVQECYSSIRKFRGPEVSLYISYSQTLHARMQMQCKIHAWHAPVYIQVIRHNNCAQFPLSRRLSTTAMFRTNHHLEVGIHDCSRCFHSAEQLSVQQRCGIYCMSIDWSHEIHLD